MTGALLVKWDRGRQAELQKIKKKDWFIEYIKIRESPSGTPWEGAGGGGKFSSGFALTLYSENW